MNATPSPLPEIGELLAQLQSTLKAGNRFRALELVSQIQQFLATEAAKGAAIELQVRALLAGLDCRPEQRTGDFRTPIHTLGPAVDLSAVRAIRGGGEPASAKEKGLVYPAPGMDTLAVPDFDIDPSATVISPRPRPCCTTSST